MSVLHVTKWGGGSFWWDRAHASRPCVFRPPPYNRTVYPPTRYGRLKTHRQPEGVKLTTHRLKLLLLIVSAWGGIFVPKGWAEPPPDPFSITLTIGWQNHCRIGYWSPLELQIASQINEPFIGTIEVSIPQDSLHRMVMQRPIVLPAGQSRCVPLMVKLGYSSDECTVRLLDRKGRSVVLPRRFDLYNSRGPGFLRLDAHQNALVAAAGRGGSRTFPKSLNDEGERVNLTHTFLPNLPHVWVGYTGLDALILHEPDWSQMNPAQQQALAQWISNGGNALIFLGTQAIPPDSPLGKLVTLKPDSLRATAVSRQVLGGWGLKTDKPLAVSAWKFPNENLPGGWAVRTRDQEGRPLELEGTCGFGRVILCGYNPRQLPLTTDAEAKRFWIAHLTDLVDPALLKADPAAARQPANGDPQFAYYGKTLAKTPWLVQQTNLNEILAYLMNIAQLEPISIWWILGILGSLAVLIGPVDYLVLKRLDRLPWTYVTFMSILAVYTAGAYFGVQYIRGGSDQVRRVTVLDKIAGTTCCWQTGYTGIFANRSDNYPLAGYAGDSWWSGAALAEQYDQIQRQDAVNVIECVQQEGNVPVNLPINIWSMRTLMDEGPGDNFPLQARVSFADGTINARIDNVGSLPVTRGAVRIGPDRVWTFGRIDPGKSITVTGPAPSSDSFFSDWRPPVDDDAPDQYLYRYYRYRRSDANLTLHPRTALMAAGTLPRTAGIERYLAAGAAVVCAAVENARTGPITVKGKNAHVNHTLYVRLVIPQWTPGERHD